MTAIDADAGDRPLPIRDALTLGAGLTVTQAVDAIRQRVDGDADEFGYAYVIDDGRHVVGVLSMRDLVLASPDAALVDVMRRDVVTAPVGASPHDVVRNFRRHRFPALPVVHADGTLAGIVTAGDLMDVMEEEATEDMLRLVGAGAEERLSSSWHYSFRMRLPWLLVSLILVGMAALVVQLFEDTIAAWAVLAAYMPVVAGIGGNASAQAMAVAIRGIATGEAGRVALRRVVARELRVGAAGGLLIGLLAGGVAVASGADRAALLGGIVAVSLFINQSVACVWGACMPFLMMRFGFDPAQSATIFTTTLTDVVGLLTLLGLATAAAMVFAR